MAALSLIIETAGAAQRPPPMPASDEIVVTGSRVGTLDLFRLRKAEAAFRANRAALAPDSTLLFQLRPKDGAALPGMTLTLRESDQTIPVRIDQLGRFSLPDLPAGSWELLHNRGKAKIAVRALIFSPGATEADRPLGDLRLQCRVGWELMKPSFSLFARAGFDALGGCSSSRIGIFFFAPQKIAAASITSASGATALPISADHRSYHPPINDQALANSARVHLRYD